MNDYIESGAIKVIEVIGVSGESFDDAVNQAVKKAAESVSGITGVEVHSWNARVREGAVVQYRASCKVAFIVK
jgi:flavin-binding protein dodecin